MTEPLRPIQHTREVPPCKGCEDRKPGCHDKCDKYKEWKQRLEAINQARKEYDKSRYNKYRRD